MDKPAQPLRILAIVNLPWDARLGAPRVWMELEEQWRAMGHVVEKFSLSDAFPGVRATRVTFALRQLIFIRRAAAFVRKHGNRFDVIDALVGTLPFSKEELGFNGIVVARSVGLYRLYDRFEHGIAERWPQPRRGKLTGRLLYQFTRTRIAAASDRAARRADLVNVPNDEEARCLREEVSVTRPVFVQPYGLTTQRRDALRAAAAPPAERLAQKRICFIGMWSPRKGSHDWREIIARIRAEVPEAQFRFLGTMLAEQAIREQLGTELEGLEFISDYDPDELPSLLAPCAVGAFPSYVEGFGLAVIEQLAAGIPTVAYRVPGPRDILESNLPELLVPAGDLPQFAAAVSRLLQSKEHTYNEIAARSFETAAGFSWGEIARTTLDAYRGILAKDSGPIICVQPFSVRSAGGGARILRGLLEDRPQPVQVVCSAPDTPADNNWHEQHLPIRPSFGAIEHSRLAWLPELVTPLCRPLFRRKFRAFCRSQRARAVHAIPHAHLDFFDSYVTASELKIPFFLQVHDDFVYSARGKVSAPRAHAALRDVWSGAQLRFVISDELGEEYCRRYGRRDFITLTDGVTELGRVREHRQPAELRIYFMGLFHLSYEENLRVLLRATSLLRAERPALRISLSLRCGQLPAADLASAEGVKVLPFGSEDDVQSDLEAADLLYLPLPFGAEFKPFVELSLSTKLITYLGSGIPIFYHGPANAAAHRLLSENEAAVSETTLEPERLAAVLRRIVDEAAAVRKTAENALELASSRFMLAQQREKFWGAIEPFLSAVARS